MKRAHRIAVRLPLAFVAVASLSFACVDATDVTLLEITGSGTLGALAYLDLDASGTPSAPDSLLRGVELALVVAATADVLTAVATDSAGAALFEDVPIGSYRVAFQNDVLGDSLSQLDTGAVIGVGVDDTVQVAVGATYPIVALEDVGATPAGTRLFTHGIALNPRLNFGDGQVHFRGASGFLRGLEVVRGGLNPGDSVRLLGRVVSDNGRPALRDVSYAILEPSARLVVPSEVSTGLAATADAASLDAALVRIRRAEIADTGTVGGHFRFWADDGSDSVEVVIRDFLVPTINTSAFRPDTIVRIREATGLLSPHDDGSGTVRWRLLPRGGSDLVIETKLADLAITTAFDTLQTSLGDTVRVTVAVTNAGPLAATMVQVRDTVPSGLAFLSATTTVGTYDDNSGTWSLSSLSPGAADTLRIDFSVTRTSPGNVFNIAQILPLSLEADPNLGNNLASASVPVS